MFDAGVLTFQEFLMREPLPLATIQNAVLEFLRGREGVVLFGAQAVNAYVSEPRMTQDINLLSSRAAFAEELREHLGQQFRIAVRVRAVGDGRGGCLAQRGRCLFQVQKSGDRRLVDIRLIERLPPAQWIQELLVIAPADLIAMKVIAYHQRRGRPKSGTHWRDIAMLLLTFPEFKRDPGPVRDRLLAAGVDPLVMAAWEEFVAQELRPADEEDEY
jgi:hypothetical protein